MLLGNIIQRRSKSDVLRVVSIVDLKEEISLKKDIIKGILAKYRIKVCMRLNESNYIGYCGSFFDGH